MSTIALINALVLRWEKDAAQYGRQVDEARRAGTEHEQMLAGKTFLATCAKDLKEIAEKGDAETERLRKENDILRGLLPALDVPCVHCGETNIAKCKLGFPGCNQADDIFCAEDEEFRHLVEHCDRRVCKFTDLVTALRAMVPKPPTAITYDNGVEIINFVQNIFLPNAEGELKP